MTAFGLPRLFDRALPHTRTRFAVVLESFGAGERLARDPDVDVSDVRRHGPYAFEGLGLRWAMHAPSVLAHRWDELAAPERELVAIGVGWAVERLTERRRPAPPAPPGASASVADGRGFHRALFRAYALRHPGRFEAPRQRDFDRGLGRGLYFALGARPADIARIAGVFPRDRRRALWLGVGVALAFTGGSTAEDAGRLVESGGGALGEGVRRGAALRRALHGDTPPAHVSLAEASIGALQC